MTSSSPSLHTGSPVSVLLGATIGTRPSSLSLAASTVTRSLEGVATSHEVVGTGLEDVVAVLADEWSTVRGRSLTRRCS